MDKEKNKNLIRILVGIITVVLILVLSTFWDFKKQNYNYAKKISEEQVHEIAIRGAQSTKDEIKNVLKIVEIAAIGYENTEELQSQESLAELLKIKDRSPFYRMGITTPDGQSISSNGAVVNISERDYFKRAMQGKSVVSDKLMSLYDGKEVVVFCVPIRNGGKVVGTLHGVYNTEKLAKVIQADDQKITSYALLINSNGEFVLPATNGSALVDMEKNIWDLFEKAVYTGDSNYETFYKCIQDGKAGIVNYRIDDKTRIACYTPVGINNWYLLQVITGEVIENYYVPINKIGFLMISKIILIFLALGVAIVIVLDKANKSRVEDWNKLQLLTNNIPGGVAEILMADDFIITYANDGFFALTGYKKEEYMGGWIQGYGTRIIVEEDIPNLLQDIESDIAHNKPIHTEYRIRKKDGTCIWISVDASILKKVKQGTIIQAIFMDITLQKNRTQQLLDNAKIDKMTGLYDKVSVQEAIKNCLKNIGNNEVHAMIIIDIDDFKNINDTYGHQVGDEAIIQLANMIKTYFRATDILGRAGGDEYIVLMKNIVDREYVERRMVTFINSTKLLEVSGHVGISACSVGATIFAAESQRSYDEIFKEADDNLYHAKKTGKSRCVITEYNFSNQVQ